MGLNLDNFILFLFSRLFKQFKLNAYFFFFRNKDALLLQSI